MVDDRPTVAVVLGRLIAPGSESKTARDVAIKGADDILEQAGAWQSMSSRQDSIEVACAFSRAGINRGHELVGRMASMGEQLGLAFAAAVESAFWSTAGDFRHRDLARRALVELQTHFVLGTGHGLANVAYRALALQPEIRGLLLARLKTTFPPFSEVRTDWKSLNKEEMRQLHSVASEFGNTAILRLIEPVIELAAGPLWNDLSRLRAKDFHRWRPQSAAIAGVPQTTPYKTLPDGSVTTEFRYPRESTEELSLQAAEIANTSMHALAITMKEFLDRFPDASEVLFDGRARIG